MTLLAIVIAGGLFIVKYPTERDRGFEQDENPAMTAFLRAQPKDILVAGSSLETDLIPAIAGRRVLTSREFALPFHLGYQDELHRRTRELILAYYAASPAAVMEFANRHGIDVFIVNRAAFRTGGYERAWSGSKGPWEPFTSLARRQLGRERYALLDLARSCAEVDHGNVAVVTRSCVQAGGTRLPS